MRPGRAARAPAVAKLWIRPAGSRAGHPWRSESVSPPPASHSPRPPRGPATVLVALVVVALIRAAVTTQATRSIAGTIALAAAARLRRAAGSAGGPKAAG